MGIGRLLAAAIGVATLAGGCVRADNTEESLRDALRQANIPDVTVEVDDDGRLVHLEGTVETLADRRRAEEIAAAIVGARGQVDNDVTVAGLVRTQPVDE